jgi:exopolyphosphatase/pppGpp-phosphohydrolase
MTVDNIKLMPQVAAGRADVIFGGSLILSEFLLAGRFDSIAVSDRGLRYGLALREAQRLT